MPTWFAFRAPTCLDYGQYGYKRVVYVDMVAMIFVRLASHEIKKKDSHMAVLLFEPKNLRDLVLLRQRAGTGDCKHTASLTGIR